MKYAIKLRSRDGQIQKSVKDARDVTEIINGLCGDVSVESILSIRPLCDVQFNEMISASQVRTW